MDLTIIQQGNFVSTGANVTLPLRQGVDWMQVYNTTQASSGSANIACKFYWQNGFPQNSMWAEARLHSFVADINIQYTTTGGFYYVDTSINRYGLINNTVTAVTNANPPVVTTGAQTGLVAGNVVRLINIVGGQQLSSMDFTVGYGSLAGGTNFSLDYMVPIVAAAGGGASSWMQVNFDPVFYPTRRYITSITQAAQAVVTLSVTHGYQVGQSIRMVVPAIFGMTQMDGLLATIVAVDTATGAGHNSITLN